MRFTPWLLTSLQYKIKLPKGNFNLIFQKEINYGKQYESQIGQVKLEMHPAAVAATIRLKAATTEQIMGKVNK